ncbi:MAG: oligosaccharide flippase family protein [Anaerolineales bacterium]|nr:oligosaccharide flippase family protein [Anaerolineales bacterium]
MQNPTKPTKGNEIETTKSGSQWTETALSRLASGTGIALFGRIFGRGFLIVGQILIARFLGPEAFGLYAIGWTMLQMGGTIAPLGLDKAAIQYATRYWQLDLAGLKGTIFQSLGLSTASGSIMALLLCLAAFPIAHDFFQNPDMTQVIRWFAPAFALISVTRVIAATTRVTQTMKYATTLEDVLPSVASLVLFIALYLLGFQLTAALGSVLTAYLLSFILGIFFLKRLFPEVFSRYPKATWMVREIMSFSLPTWLAGAFTMFIIWVNRLLVGVFRPEADVGIYQASSQISLLFALILSAITYVFSPMIANLFHRGKRHELQELFVISTKWGLYLSLPVFIIVITAPRELLTVLFGQIYQVGAPILFILAIGQLVNVASGSVGWMLMMTGHHIKWFWTTTAMLISSVIINIILTPQIGLMGAATATSLAVCSLYIIGLVQVRRHLGFWPYDKRYRKMLLASILSVGVVIASRYLNLDNPALRLTLTATLAIGVFGIGLFILGFDEEEGVILRHIGRRMFRNVTQEKHVNR